MSDEKLRFGIIGIGKMGLLHASLLNVMPNVEIVALCDKSALMGRLFKKVFSSGGTHVVKDLDQLRDLNLDAVYVTTPISSHTFIINHLLNNGITRNVFVEKTLASNYSQAVQLCEVAEKVGGVNMVGYMKRYNVVFRKAKELLSQGALGEAESFKAYAYSSDFLGLTKESKSSASRGGALKDTGSHIIDLILWLFGDLMFSDILSVSKDVNGSETAVAFTTSSRNGLEGQVDISQSMPNYRMPEFGLSIQCSEGKIDVNDDRLRLESKDGVQQKWYRHNLGDTVYFSIGEAEYFREDEQFVSSLRGRSKLESTFASAARVDHLIEEVRNRSNQQ